MTYARIRCDRDRHVPDLTSLRQSYGNLCAGLLLSNASWVKDSTCMNKDSGLETTPRADCGRKCPWSSEEPYLKKGKNDTKSILSILIWVVSGSTGLSYCRHLVPQEWRDQQLPTGVR